MIGGAAPGVPAGAERASAGARTQILSDFAADALDDYDPLRRNGKKKKASGAGGTRTGLWVGVGLALAIAAGGAIYVGVRSGEAPAVAPLQAQVASAENGALAMTVALAGQPAGTIVRYGHQQQTLDAHGQAHFVLDDLGDRIGAIDLPIEIAPPNAAASRRTARIVLAYRVDPDLSGLVSEPPTVRLVFHVVRGAQLRIDNQLVATDASGVGVAMLDNIGMLPIDGPAVHEQLLHVQVNAPDGTQAAGAYTLRVPRTALAMERPVGSSVLTTAERLVLRGQAPGATRVTVNTAVATLTNGNFESTIALPGPGHVPVDIVAFSATGAPARAHLDVERIAATDTAALDRFVAASPGTISELATGTLATGRHVHFTGRVLGAPRDYEGGQTFQLVVSDRTCPAGRCVAWVDAEPGQSAAMNANIDVYGTVSGRRSSVNAGGERRSDPVIHAAAVR